MQLQLPNLLGKKTSIGVLVFVLGVTGLIFLIDQAPPAMNQTFDTYSLIRPEQSHPYQASVYGIPTFTETQDYFAATGAPNIQQPFTFTRNEMTGIRVSPDDETYGNIVHGYAGLEDVFMLNQANSISFIYAGNTSGLTTFSLDYYLLDQTTQDTKISVMANCHDAGRTNAWLS